MLTKEVFVRRVFGHEFAVEANLASRSAPIREGRYSVQRQAPSGSAPAGTRGCDDLRHRASREPLGRGLRPRVASPGDLVRMLEAHDRQREPLVLETMRRVLELERARVLER